MSNRFEDKVVIVTGAGTGIGKAVALQIAREGGSVVCATRSSAGLGTVEEIVNAGGKAIHIFVDVTEPEEIENVVKQTMDTYGKIDGLYNNAAITGNNQPVEAYDLDVFNEVISTNLTSQFLMMKYALPHMSRDGSVVNCSSLHGTRGMAGDVAYSASKHAVIGLTRSVAAEQGLYGIRVNAVCPGPVATKMMRRYEGMLSDDIPALEHQIAQGGALKRFGTEEEISQVVCFLLSDDSSYVTGSVQMVDGGYSAI